jgi:CcmD family protein
MNAIKFLFAAYLATWLIHGIYIAMMSRRFNRLKRELKELERDK